MKNERNRKSGIYPCGILTTCLMVLGILMSTVSAQGQTSYRITQGSQIKVLGTSNLHDWNMSASTFTLEGIFKVRDNELLDIKSLSFSLPVTNLKSKDDLMDTRAHKTLKAAEFGRISFRLNEAALMPQHKLKATGSLTIGGVTNEVVITSSYVVNADDTITFKGSKAVRMSDHKIKAPSFMMGALRTGNDVTIEFLLKFKKQNNTITQN